MPHPPQFETTATGLLVRAPAKINLSLLIAGKRPDGFHAIETVMTKINLYDTVHVERADRPGIELVCDGPCWAPTGPENLVLRAAHALAQRAGPLPPLRLTLTKNIPAGTGLGSASSDAAATLLGLDRLLALNLPRESLHALAADLGSDVAFFLYGPLALCEGRGEIVTPLTEDYDFEAVLCIPPLSVSTRDVYTHYRHDASLYERWHREISVYISENRIDSLVRICVNMLSMTCFALEDDLASLRRRLQACDIGPVGLSGSGCALYCPVGGGVSTARETRDTIDTTANCPTHTVERNPW